MKLSRSLRNFSVLITGAASGIGRELATHLCHEGVARLILADRDYEGLEELSEELEEISDRLELSIHSCDISKQGEITKLATAIKDLPVDVLVNNAGIFYSGTFEKMKPADFQNIVNVNLMGTVRMSRALLPQLLKSKPGGRILNIASAAGLIGAPGMCAYSTTKFAIVGFSQALRAELDGRIPVSVICPTFVKTNIAKNAVTRSGGTEANKKAAEMDAFIQKVGCSTEKMAKIIVDTIHSGKEMVLVNPDTHALYYINKFMPKVSRGLISKAYKVLLDRGVIDT